MRRCHPLVVALASCLLGPLSGHAQADPSIRIPPVADSTRQRIAEGLNLPPGFEFTLFAAPPHLTYPVCIEPGGPGVLFVCTDPNLNLDRARNRGRILRFVDENADGVADRYTVFADSLDAVRGLIFDDGILYAMHAPTLSAYRDTDEDGVADREEVLVHGLGFTLDDRGGDHTANGITLGIDGWIYIAVGDYGFLGATGSDGTQLRLHGGGVVRVRPDGSELEIVARGTRNIFDLALDPFLRIFARDNTNNGQGWNSRLHYLPPGVNAGYPALFTNFPAEIHQPLTDFGAGAATAALWIDDPAYASHPLGTLYTADWALNRVYRHALTPRGATFTVDQTEFIEIPHPADMALDARSVLHIASLAGGSYTYAGEHVGYIAGVRPTDAPPSAPTPAQSVDEAQLVTRILTGSRVARLEAQREILRRGSNPAAVRRLEEALERTDLPAAGRIAALFTLKQLLGPASHPTLLRAVGDPLLRPIALRALADRRGELVDVPAEPFIEALDDDDPGVQLQGAIGLARLGTPGAAAHLFRAATAADPVVAHVARNALVEMGAAGDAIEALASTSEKEREAALYILGRLHTPSVVTALAADLQREPRAAARRQVAGALARVYHREGVWNGAWWDNQPNTEGPYYAPVRWEESARIRPLLVASLVAGRGAALDSLVATFVREGVVPRQSEDLFRLADDLPESERIALIDDLTGGREPGVTALARMAALGGRDITFRSAVARALVAIPLPPDGSAASLHAAAVDPALPADLRAQALAALARIPSALGAARTLDAHASVVPELSAQTEMRTVWRRFVTDRKHADEVESFGTMATTADPPQRVLGYAVLIQIAGTPRNPETARARAAAIIEAGWGDSASADALVQAISLLGLEDRYAVPLAAHRAGLE